MVRSFTPSDIEEDVRQKKKHSRRRSYSRSPQREYSRKKKHRRYSRSESPVAKRKIKEEPVTPPRDKHRKKEDRFPAEDREDKQSRSREDGRDKGYDRHRGSRQVRERSRDDRSEQQRERHHNDEKRRRDRRQRGGNPFRSEENEMEYGQSVKKEVEEEQPKEQPNFEVSGKLTEDTNTYRGVVIKYNQPPEARKPKKRWRLYPFKGDEALPVLHIHRQSAYLLGRDRLVVDIPTDHPSCSKQHAVLQFRMVDFEREDGTTGRRIAPYLIDLDSSNGSFINNKKIESQRFVELLEKDVIKFGFSSREYVVLHDKTDASELNDEASSPE